MRILVADTPEDIDNWPSAAEVFGSSSKCENCKAGRKPWKCPSCGKMTTDFPALSRRDNMTDICSACGTREALEDYANHLRDEKAKKELM